MNYDHSPEIHCCLPCYNNSSSNKQAIEIIDYLKGDEITRKPPRITFVFVIRGEFEFSLDRRITLLAGENDFFIVPGQADYTMLGISNGRLLLYCVHSNMKFFRKIRENVFRRGLPDNNTENTILQMDMFIRKNIDMCIDMIERRLTCNICLKFTMEILFTFIISMYPAEKLTGFFAPAFGINKRKNIHIDSQFRNIILENGNKVFSVDLMAKLTNKTVPTFRNHFHRIFGIAPKVWIERERKKFVYSELTASNKPLKEVALSAGLGSETRLYNYCSKTFGKTAKSIRKSNIS
jgi:AraC-like DNA-binding protein